MNNYKVYLAPLEGLADGPMRKVLCAHGGYDLCFSEFIRVTDLVVSPKTLIREIPEYENDCKTADGTPLRVQLLGDNPDTLAKSAVIACDMGAKSIDLNFGCPSRFVHHAGAMLLKEPELMHDIVQKVRDTLDEKYQLSVKIRLGFLDKSEAFDIVKAIAVDGVSEITVHCRTRKDLYKNEALDWSALSPLHECANGITLIANGNVNSLKDAKACEEITLCNHFMCGRGAFPVPNLGHVIKGVQKEYPIADILRTSLEVVEEFIATTRTEKTVMDRAKQFLGYARVHKTELNPFFKTFCRCTLVSDGVKLIEQQIAYEEQTVHEL
ncbi:MAG: tRNA-dihydrouridine synthase family protein [Aeromonadales bacterium]|nr:tRNA-dihydrouridine synthase family protein [Aeromonadales bacterium]